MDPENELDRFDIESIEYDKEGVPNIPRISFTVPKSYRKEFLQDMVDEIRNTPGQQLMAIFVRYYRMKRLNQETGEFQEHAADERRKIPVYGPKPLKSDVAPSKARSADE